MKLPSFGADQNYRNATRWEMRDDVRYFIQPESASVRYLGHGCDPLTFVRRRVTTQSPCDVAHLFQPFPSAYAAWCRANAKVRFYDWDDLWSGGLMSGPYKRWSDSWVRLVVKYLEHRLPRRADHVTAISHFLEHKAKQHGAHKTTLVNSGSWVVPQNQSKEEMRSGLGLRPQTLYAGFMGRTTAELNWCYDVLQENLTRFPNLRLAICGPAESELVRIDPTVRERIDYLGQVSPERAKMFAACIDVGLLP